MFPEVILENKELSKQPIYLIFLFGNLNFDLNHFIAISSVLMIVYMVTQSASIEQSLLY